MAKIRINNIPKVFYSQKNITPMIPQQHFERNSNYNLNLSNINQRIIHADYAVRGELSIRADELRSQLKSGKALPFKNIINCNIGNPQGLGQKPNTFLREVILQFFINEFIK